MVAYAPLASVRGRPGAVGFVAPAAAIKIISPDGETLPANESGEVWTKSPGMATHYVDDPEGTATNFKDGWFRTGDIGRLSPDRLLVIEGREDDIVNIGGVKISGNAIEHAAREVNGVSDAGVLAFETSSGGWVLYCAIVSNGRVDATVMAKQLDEPYRIGIKVVELPEIPRNTMGKVQRDQLKTAIAKLED
jgi:acyl-CoA synthetase (AMP-forming)/AMP-acid ligase II